MGAGVGLGVLCVLATRVTKRLKSATQSNNMSDGTGSQYVVRTVLHVTRVWGTLHVQRRMRARIQRCLYTLSPFPS